MARKFDCFMLHVGAGTNEKLAILTDAEYRAHVSGILAVAATAPVRGRLLVGDMEAEPIQIAKKAGVSVKVAQSAIRKMQRVGVLYRDEELGCWAVHDWEQLNPEPKLGDPTAARRQALHRNATLRKALRERDQDMCRYCGVDVDFLDRRSRAGGTYDHVDPEGDNTMDNLVVACRSCNSGKGSRTPEQAGLVLRPTPSRSGVSSEQYRVDEVEEEGEGEGTTEETRGRSLDVPAGVHPQLEEVLALFSPHCPPLQMVDAAVNRLLLRAQREGIDALAVADNVVAAFLAHGDDHKVKRIDLLLKGEIDRYQERSDLGGLRAASDSARAGARGGRSSVQERIADRERRIEEQKRLEALEEQQRGEAA
jgi:5-methylcytosine-specific restriction endonuclease McrA